MHNSASCQQGKFCNNESSTPDLPPKSSKGLKRQEGTSVLNATFDKIETPSLLKPSKTMAALPKFSSFQPIKGSLKNPEKPVPQHSRLPRTKTTSGPLNYGDFKEVPEKLETLKRQCENRKVTPLRLRVARTPGGSFSSVSVLPKAAPTLEGEVTPPSVIRRTISGSMILRKTPTRTRKYEEEESPKKRVRRSGSVPKRARERSAQMESPRPTLTRERTPSINFQMSSSDSIPTLTPQKMRFRRARVQSESRTDDITTPSSRRLETSPSKKRTRFTSELSPSKSKSNFRLEENGEQKPTTSREIIFESVKVDLVQKVQDDSLKMGQSTSSFLFKYVSDPPRLATRSTSGDTYYSATDEQPEDVIVDQEVLREFPAKKTTVGLSVTPLNSHREEEEKEMVPLVKKQVSIDEKCIEDEEDEGFGDSTKTIKRGQGGALARSLSLKLSPRKDQQKLIGPDTEKSCSTPSLPTAPLVRQTSTSSLRFKVSPSTFLRPLPTVASTPDAVVAPSTFPVSTPIIQPVPQEVAQTSEISEPSTSKTLEETPVSRKKSSLKNKETVKFAVRNDNETSIERRRRVKYSGLKVFYFDRRQGDMTVPSEGEVTLDMHTEHHTQRYFPLSSGKRPLLDLELYSDEELSEGEVIEPDSDPECEYEEFSSTHHKAPFTQKQRIKILKKAGIRVERNAVSNESIRQGRVDCGCSCKNGICIPETCECVLNGLQCQVDGGPYPHPCICLTESCSNPNGRIFYDQEAVKTFVNGTISRIKAGMKTGIEGSPIHKKFSDWDEDGGGGEKDLCEDPSEFSTPGNPPNVEGEEPPRYPVTPIYTTRRSSHCSQSDLREGRSELPMSLSERMQTLQSLENDVFLEDPRQPNDADIPVATAETILEEQDEEAYSPPEAEADNERLEATMSPPQTTMVV